MTGTLTEHDEQVALFEWRDLQVGVYPELALLHAIPNGAKLPWRRNKNGQRWSPEAIRLIKEGLTSGIPDVHLPVPHQGFASLYIEMKRKPNKPSDDQVRMIDLLRQVGNRVEICWSFEEARDTLIDYMTR